MKTSMNNYIGDELANKVKYLHEALFQANKMISFLETENQSLKDHLSLIATTELPEQTATNLAD